MFGKVKRFFNDVSIELKKTTWPTKKDVIGTTMVTCIMVGIVAAFLWVVDLGLIRLLNFIFKITD
jgi:preprotein translocase subunit SecE